MSISMAGIITAGIDFPTKRGDFLEETILPSVLYWFKSRGALARLLNGKVGVWLQTT